ETFHHFCVLPWSIRFHRKDTPSDVLQQWLHENNFSLSNRGTLFFKLLFVFRCELLSRSRLRVSFSLACCSVGFVLSRAVLCGLLPSVCLPARANSSIDTIDHCRHSCENAFCAGSRPGPSC